MNNPSKLQDLDVKEKRVIVRADLDVGEDFSDTDVAKLQTIIPTLKYLLDQKSKIIIVGHRGRPDGKVDGKLSLFPVSQKLSELLGVSIDFVYDLAGHEAKEKAYSLQGGGVIMFENLRFDAREESNDEGFAKALADLGEVYINEGFSASHREHASVTGIPKFLQGGLGLHFEKEIENLNKVIQNPKKPVVIVVSGIKKDKLDYALDYANFADKILVAGRLPAIIDARGIGQTELDSQYRSKIIELVNSGKMLIADLIQDKEDITVKSMEKFEEIIKTAGTVVVGGPIGKFEDEGHRQGTKRVFEAAVNNSEAFKVAGGGDTEQAIETLNLKDKFDWVSVGGGASLEYLAKATLPGIEALKKSA